MRKETPEQYERRYDATLVKIEAGRIQKTDTDMLIDIASDLHLATRAEGYHCTEDGEVLLETIEEELLDRYGE